MSRTTRSTLELVGEQAIEPVGRKTHGHGVETAPALVALEHGRCANIESQARGIDNHFGERRDVLQSHVETLPGDRMNDVCGIADERNAIGDKRTGDKKAQRMNTSRARRR